MPPGCPGAKQNVLIFVLRIFIWDEPNTGNMRTLNNLLIVVIKCSFHLSWNHLHYTVNSGWFANICSHILPFSSFILLSDPCHSRSVILFHRVLFRGSRIWLGKLGSLTRNFVWAVLKMIKAKKQRVRLNRINLGKVVFIMEEICWFPSSNCCSVSLTLLLFQSSQSKETPFLSFYGARIEALDEKIIWRQTCHSGTLTWTCDSQDKVSDKVNNRNKNHS